jgi:hypothetical protein
MERIKRNVRISCARIHKGSATGGYLDEDFQDSEDESALKNKNL